MTKIIKILVIYALLSSTIMVSAFAKGDYQVGDSKPCAKSHGCVISHVVICSNGSYEVVDTGNDSHFYAKGESYKTFDAAATASCHQKSKITLKKNATCYVNETRHGSSSIVAALTDKDIFSMNSMWSNLDSGHITLNKRTTVVKLNYVKVKEVVKANDGTLLWNISPSDATEIKKLHAKVVRTYQGYFKVLDGDNKTWYVAESDVE